MLQDKGRVQYEQYNFFSLRTIFSYLTNVIKPLTV